MTSTSEIISNWKKKAEPDYFSLFLSLWVSFNAWFKDKTNIEESKTERNRIDEIKDNTNHNLTFSSFSRKIMDISEKGNLFRSHLIGLDQAIKSANFNDIDLDKKFKEIAKNNFSNFRMRKNIFELRSLTRPTNATTLEDDYQKVLYKSVIEILYQIRCKFFHGQQPPNEEFERVVKYSYLILFDLMENL